MHFKRFKGQNYEDLKKSHNSGNLFVDNIFLANSSSLAYSDSSKYDHYDIKWKRPSEIVGDPMFLVEGFDRIDINQGQIGNCWFLAALAGICECPMILAKVIPRNQNFDKKEYCGMFHFRFWMYGDWHDVVIDDYLPYSENFKQLIFCNNRKQENEFWPPLLEKAYAKLNGSYEALEGGILSSAFVNLTGGIIENLFPKQIQNDLVDRFWSSLFLSYFKNSLMGCALEGEVSEGLRPDGLHLMHAYTITKLAIVMLRSKKEQKLIRIKNPHGLGSNEWTGDWSDRSSKWKEVVNLEKVDISNENEGEFWMSFEDFMKTWDRLYVCHLTPASFLSEIDKDDTWNSKVIHHSWTTNTSGGCDITSDSYLNNPKLLLCVDNPESHKISTVMISLTQKKDLLERTVKQLAYEFKYCIRIDVYKLSANYRKKNYTQKKLRKIMDSISTYQVHYSDFVNTSEVMLKLDLDNGLYLVMPCTDTKNINLEFMLQLFTEENVKHTGFLNQEITEKEYDLKSFIEYSSKNQNLDTYFSNPGILKGKVAYHETCKEMPNLNRFYNNNEIKKTTPEIGLNKESEVEKVDEPKSNNNKLLILKNNRIEEKKNCQSGCLMHSSEKNMKNNPTRNFFNSNECRLL